MNRIAFILFLASLVACQSALEVDDSETGRMQFPQVGFDPGNKVIPLPNNLLKDAETGKIAIPELCGETATTKSLRENILNQLDGFGTFRYPLTTSFSEAVDPASLEGNVLLYKVGSSSGPVAIDVITTTLIQWEPDCSSSKYVPGISISAQTPLDETSTYVVALKNGIKTLDGDEFSTSLTWALVRQPTAPVVAEYTDGVATRIVTNYTALDPNKEEDFAKLAGIDLLWRAHHAPLDYLSSQIANYKHREILLAWSFDTMTVRKPFDPNDPESLVSKLSDIAAHLTVTEVIVDDPGTTENEVVDYYQEDFDYFFDFTEGEDSPYTCDSSADPVNNVILPCDGVGKIVRGNFLSPSYQYDMAEGEGMSPGPWMDPINPPLLGGIARIPFIALIPASAPPAEGYPTIIWGHGVNRSKEQMYRFAARVVNEGYAMIAFDWAKHGARSVRISDDNGSGCSDADVYSYNAGSEAPSHDHRVGRLVKQCYAAVVSPILPTVRDTFRQSQLDAFQFMRAVKNCADGTCDSNLQFDLGRLGYMGHSLGVLIALPFVANHDEFKASLFSVGSSGWIDVLANTPNYSYLCTIVDGLVGLGAISGTTVAEAGLNATCMTGEFKTQPGYWSFIGTARWILDSADSTNYLELLKPRIDNGSVVAIMQMCQDETIPQIGTQNLATGLGLATATCSASNTNTEANANVSTILADKTSVWLTYESDDNKAYYHDALTSPNISKNYVYNNYVILEAAGARGILASYQVQNDVVEFFKQNL